MSAVPRLGGRVRAPHEYGRFVVLQRTDGKWIVYDPERPFARRTAWFGDSEVEACNECKRLSDEATARGETNERERKGFKHDWSDPQTWERCA